MVAFDPSRRAWMRGVLGRLGTAAHESAEAAVRARIPSHPRPPGAVAEPLFMMRCTRCDACVEACPHLAIFTFTDAAGVVAGTPVMSVAERACHLCEGFPCAAACPEEALAVPETGTWRFGRVRIDPARCLPFMGPECGACAGLCPSEAQALRLRAGRPEVDADACTGCGLCIEACPTSPKAIVFEELRV